MTGTSRKPVRIFAFSVLLMAGAMQASAQTPSESITVTATKWREVLHAFAKAFAAPTRLAGKIARWERGVCPVVVGQNSHFTAFITQRIKYIGLAAGAPVNTEPSCAPNIEIVFTATPQALLDDVRKNHSDYLGYATSNAGKDALATVTRPIQAWYAIETTDFNGKRTSDRGGGNTGGMVADVSQPNPSDTNATGFARKQGLKGIPAYAVSGSRLDDGIHSGFSHILIVVDDTKLAGQKIVPLADYISMLALTELNSLDTCQQLASVVNILAGDCPHPPDGLTQYDLAYLQGLYKMSGDRKPVLQQDEIGDAMADVLAKPN